MENIRVNDFIERLTCPKSQRFKYLETEDQSNLLLAIFFTQLSGIVERSAGKEAITEEVTTRIRTEAEKLYEDMLRSYEVSWFGGSEKTLSKKRNLMWKFFNRFFDEFYLEYLVGAKVISAGQKCRLTVTEKGQQISFEEPVHLILQKSGGYAGLLLNVGKNFRKKSMNGRSDASRIETDLRYAVVKCSLEQHYKGINLVGIFYQEGESKGELAHWICNGTQKSNVFTMPFSEFYEEGELCEEVLLSRGMQVVYDACEERQSKKCAACRHSSDCLVQTFSKRKPAEKKEFNWTVPEYDDAQKEFITSDAKEILVCAGPGSGKTSSLIGRVLYLAEKGYPTERMLLISYTETAAGELKARLTGKFDEDEMPRIGTLHSVAIEIDRLYAKARKVKPHNILTESLEKKLVKRVLESYDHEMTGIEYRNFLEGRYSTVNMVASGLTAFRTDPEAFFRKYKERVEDEWEKLERDVQALKDAGHYITYDEVILNAIDILEKDKAISKFIHHTYEYIMVDEYQDINKEQEKLISLLQGDTGALTCIGDDDQAIYAFKGCSSKFMLAFSERHPGAQVILCRKNYRSTKGIVDFSNSILRKMNKDTRIPKEIVYAEYAKEGEKPYLVENNRIETIDSIISSVIADGYRYEDIAIIATTNASLGVLHDTLKAPSELASAYIVNDFLFQVVMNCLALVTKADATLNPYFRLGHVFEKDKAWMDDVNCRSMRRDEVYELLMFAKKLADETPAHFVTRLAAYLDMDDSNSEKAVLGIAEQCNGNLMEFYQTMYDMRFFGEGKKIEYPIKDKVTLITSHSCKGMEWPVVIVYDTENFYAEISADGKYSMDARLFYVAASRAKEHLYFLKQEGSETLIDDSEFITRKRVAS